MLLQQQLGLGAGGNALAGFPNGLVGLPAAQLGQTPMNQESFQAQKELHILTNLYKTQLCKHYQ